MERYEQQFKKGILEMLILQLISLEKSYGYDLILKLREYSGGLFHLKEGTLYPLLYRLVEDGLIYSEKDPAPGRKRGRKYYAITATGSEMAKQLASYWNDFSQSVNTILDLEQEAK